MPIFKRIFRAKDRACTAAIYLDGNAWVVSFWTCEDPDRYVEIDRWEFDGPIHGPDAKAAYALAIGGARSAVRDSQAVCANINALNRR